MALRAVWRSAPFSFYHPLFLLLVSFRSSHRGGLDTPEKHPVDHESRKVTLLSQGLAELKRGRGWESQARLQPIPQNPLRSSIPIQQSLDGCL